VPVRIYALAKELSLDSKELVEICRKAGIPGKGSALASLDDDEAAKIKAYLGGGDKKGDGAGDSSRSPRSAARTEQPVTPYTRDDYIAPAHGGKIRVLDVGRSAVESPEEEQDAEAAEAVAETAAAETAAAETAAAETAAAETPAAETAAAETPAAETPAAETPAAETPAAETPAAETPAAVAPGARPPAVRPLAARPPVIKPPVIKPPAAKPPGVKAPRRRRAPVIKLANLPDAKQPSPPPKPAEPKAQKPEIRLPKHAIAGHKAGQPPPLDRLTKTSAKPKKAGARDKKKPGKAAPPSPAEAPLSGKGTSKRRRGKTSVEGSDNRGLAGMAAARADRQKSRKTRARGRQIGDGIGDQRKGGGPRRRPRTLTRKRGVSTAAPRKEKATLELPCTVRSFSEATGVAAVPVLMALNGMGIDSPQINSQISDELAEMLAAEMGVELEFKHAESLEESLIEQLEEQVDDADSLKPRAPVITFLGHVDHGKTSLLDYIIGTNVVAGEAGGITQHIRAYEIFKGGRRISFVDTPGHEAFTEMRARGANVTDIAVLVVAVDDGVMPQTEEAISHAKAAGVPIIVALNKSDLPGTDATRALQQLAALDVLPSEWGGDVEVVRTSATIGDGVDDLLETILVTAELHEYHANPTRNALGVCLEAEQESGRGVITKLIVKNGTLKVGDVVVCGMAHGRVKAMYDTLKARKRVKQAGPSTPVNVTGFDRAPEAGDTFHVLDDISQAREIANLREDRSREQSLAGVTTKVSFEEFQRRLEEGSLAEERDVATLNLIIRADVRGSIEAMEKELSKLDHPEVDIRILHKAVGAITAADIMLAHASQAVVVGFNVIPDEAARSLADEKQVEIRRYEIIYKMTDDVKATLEGKLKPDERVVELGHALVKRVFTISRVGTVAGCYVVRGAIERGCRVRVNRDGRTIGNYDLESLRHDKDDVKEIPRGMECGMRLAGFNDVKQDDVLEAYKIEEVARTL